MAQQQQPPSQALDDLIMGTNSSSIVSKRSVERLYHSKEPQFFRYFVANNKFQRRSPLINRGYWLRLRAIDRLVGRFLSRPSSKPKVVVNLGCGSDALPWQCHARYPSACNGALFVDIDYPQLMLKKRHVVLQTPQLEALTRNGLCIDFTPLVLLKSQLYCQLGCDLRQLHHLDQSLASVLPSPDCEILFVAEVSLTYMDTLSANALLKWASCVCSDVEFCLLEQILPQGPNHAFAKTMLAHFDKLKTPPKSVHRYQTLDCQRARFQSHGWRAAQSWDLWDLWSSNDFVSPTERIALDMVEPFDEWEEFMLFARHYCLIHASMPTSASCPRPADTTEKPTCNQDDFQVRRLLDNAPKRRFGDCLMAPNTLGAQYLIHMMGTGTSGRCDSYHIYSLNADLHMDPPKLPLSGPTPRVAFSMTTLGDFGVLLVGGRSSPSSPLSDCWIFLKESQCRWQATWKLPIPLFRHSAVRLARSSLVLVMGGKTGPSSISDASFVFDPQRGWLKCRLEGSAPRPTFGALAMCMPCLSSKIPGLFQGLYAGGIGQDGRVATEKYAWRLHFMAKSEPTIQFELLNASFGANTSSDCLELFGAKCVDLGSQVMICGGMGQNASFQGYDLIQVTTTEDESYSIQKLGRKDASSMPFIIGSSLIASDRGFLIIGGGATCFSMGTFWESGFYHVELHQPSNCWRDVSSATSSRLISEVELVETRKVVVSNSSIGQDVLSTKATMAPIPRIQLGPDKTFDQVASEGKPVVIQGLDIGSCLDKWTSSYMVERVGKATEVVVHWCQKDDEKMDFNSKNFDYISDSFENVMAKMEAGARMYLRCLSRDKPTEQPADLEKDFPQLSPDLCLPPELSMVKDRLFSSILRVSGRVTMWLHYDVMANVYMQIRGERRMMLFPPSDVRHLSLAPGASSSSVNVFDHVETLGLAATHPHHALLKPGDVLFLPSLWLHSGQAVSDMSVAVNVFFKHLDGDCYAAGRDVYGNKDLAAYERGRLDVARIAKAFRHLPLETRDFYMSRLAQELEQAAQDGLA
ncbi:hypothetical protein CDD81_2499 [Ophiocordyceps australis]|uniref:tRNA wybutosine-synthesizing protein 4 n=1 Tax=Ophiocordyceps australis TaxID=1399860 RepID=A0A2C5Y7D5_9HYPO|nr:hypothetical protein CDD81_2499 [Ophiocordyceps australis]